MLFGYLSLPIAAILIGLHVYFHSQSATELKVVLICASTGFLIDFILAITGIFEFSHHFAGSSIPPAWLFAIWLGFATTLRTSLSYFRKHILLAVVLGAISGTSSYIGAAKLGAVVLPFGIINTSIVLAVIWAALFPAMILISERLERNYAQTYA